MVSSDRNKVNRIESEGASPYDVELRQVFKVYNGETAVCGVNLGVKPGEFFSILGPSGCGKTTTLRLIAGFESPTSGEVLIQRQVMNQVPPYRRPVNTVFQSYALFNHLNVAENVAFGLKLKNLPKGELRDRVKEALVRVQMDGYANRFPHQLSGGQQQRVALARALVNQPTVVLLDEPLGALDLKLRKEMQVELSRLHQELGLTFVMVTHDQEEALSLSDRIAVMRGGQVEQVGTPSEIYEQPRTTFVADFIGDTNLLEGYIAEATGELYQVNTSRGLVITTAQGDNPGNGHRSQPRFQSRDEVVLSIRPEKMHLSAIPVDHVPNCFRSQVRHGMYLGTHVQYVVQLESGDLMRVRQPNHPGDLLTAGSEVYVYWSPQESLTLAA